MVSPKDQQPKIITAEDGTTTWEDGVPYDASKPFRCTWDGCEKAFSRMTYVTRHAKLAHQNLRPHECTACGKQFGRSDVLTVHQRTCAVLNGKTSTRKAGDPPRKRTRKDASPPEQPDFALRYSCLNCLRQGFACDGSERCQTCVGLNAVCSYAPRASTSRDTGYDASRDNSFDTSRDNSLDNVPAQLPPLYATGYTQMSTPEFSLTAPISASPARMDSTLALPSSPGAWNRYLGFNLGSPSAPVPALVDPGCTSSSSSSSDKSPHAFTDAENDIMSAIMPWSPPTLTGGNPMPSDFQALLAAESLLSPSPLAFQDPPYWDLSMLDDKPFDQAADRFSFHPQRLIGIANLNKAIGFELPKASRLASWANYGSTTLLSALPILHLPTFDSTSDMALNFAMSVAGASALRYAAQSKGARMVEYFEPEAEGVQASEMLVRKRGFLVADFARKADSELAPPPADMPHVDVTTQRPFTLIRSMLLYQLTGLDHADAGQRASAETYHASLVDMARRWHLPLRASNDSAVTPIGLKSSVERWHEWVSLESMRRVTWLIHLCDFAVASRGIATDARPLLTLDEMKGLRLPCADICWTAPDAEAWSTFESLVGLLPPTLPTVLRTLCQEAEPVQPIVPYIPSNLAACVIARALAFIVERAHVRDCAGLEVIHLRRCSCSCSQCFGLPQDPQGVRRRVQMAQRRLELTNLEGGEAASATAKKPGSEI